MDNRRIFKILFLNFITMMVFTMAHPVTPTLMIEVGLPSYMFGVLYSTMAVAQFVMSPIWGKISDERGRKNMLIMGVIGYGVGQIGFATVTNPYAILIFRLISGGLSVGFITSCIAYISDVSTNEDRIKYLSYHTATTSIASSAGSLLGGYIGLMGYKYTFISQLVLSIIISIGIYLFIDETVEPSKNKIKIDLGHLKLTKNSIDFRTKLGTMMIVMTLITFATTSYTSTINYFIETVMKLPTNINGAVMALSGIIALFMNVIVNPYVGRKFNEDKSIIVTTLIAGLSMIIGVMISKISLIASITLLAVFIATTAMTTPMQQSIVSKLAKDNYGEVMGIQYSYKALGMVLGSLVAGFVFDYGNTLPFLFGGITCTLAFILLLKKKI